MRPLDVAAAALEGRELDRLAVVGAGSSLGRAELDAAVTARAEELRVQGVAEGSLHPVVLDADLDGVLTLLALWRLGTVPAPLNARSTEREREAAVARLDRAPDGAQAVLWTSGTSGSPRGVALGRAGLEAHVRAATERLELDGSEVWLASLSPAHVGGLALVARALLTGAALVAHGPIDTHGLVRLLRRRDIDAHRPAVTHLSLVPTQLDRLLGAWGADPAPSALRCVLIGGAHAPGDLVHRAVDAGWPVSLTYGMTEMWSQVATAPPALTRSRPGTVGAPLPGVEVAFSVDGELLVRGPTRALGYVGSDDAPLADADGWYRTGDLGSLDDEGLLWITGRRSERIISGGVNVDPAEVEDVLRAHPAVRDAAVVGLPSREWGETVAAALVPVWDSFDLTEVEDYVRARLSGPKRPKMWKVEANLPRNANGKVDRAAVADLFNMG
ncbi:MAG: AMP-binding protein [Gemmatimonadota bacterium]